MELMNQTEHSHTCVFGRRQRNEESDWYKQYLQYLHLKSSVFNGA